MPNEQLTLWLNKITVGMAQLPMDKVRLGLYALLSLWIINSLVALVWILVPVPQMQPLESKPVLSAPGTTQATQETVDVSVLQNWNLFGKMDADESAKEAPTVAVVEDNVDIEAKETRLPLTLQGLIQTHDPKNALAVISHQNKQAQYKIGDKVPGGARVILAKVLHDRAILDNAGRFEALLLYDEEAMRQAASRAAKTPQKKKAASKGGSDVIDWREDNKKTKMAADYRRQLLENPVSLADVIRVSVAKDKDGSVIGYKIRPGKHREQFTQFGFKPNDIVTSINGIELNNPSKALEVYRLLREAKDANFSVKRGDEDLTMIVGLGDE